MDTKTLYTSHITSKIKVGDTITYDLLLSNSGLDRRKGLLLYHSGSSHSAEGMVKDIKESSVIISGTGYLGYKEIPLEAIF